MVYQTQANATISYKVQSGLGTPASGSGATVLRTTGGQGGRLSIAPTESAEVRRDGMRTRGRHGRQKTSGSYSHEVSIDAFDDIFEAVFRGTYEAALVITEATGSLTSITTTASTIVAGGGSWLTAGLRVGDVIRLTNHSTSANNSRNLRITGLTASTITVPETLTLNATPDTTFTITRPGQKLINPAAGSLVKRYFTIEEYEADIDQSELFSDCVWGSLKFHMAPNGILMADTSWVGTGVFAVEGTSPAPILTTPTLPTGVPLAVVDATIRLGSSDLVDLTGFDITFDISPGDPDVIASRTSPDVFTGNMAVTINMTALRSDLTRVSSYLAEDVLSLHVLAVELETAPADFVSIYVPNFTLGAVDKSALANAGGPRTQTLSIPASLVGKDETGGAYDACMAKIIVSNT